MFFRLPDDENKKNMMCRPINAIHLPTQWFEFHHLSLLNGEQIAKTLGIKWIRRSRLTPLHHMSLISFIKTIIYTKWNQDEIKEKLKLFSEQLHMYGKFVD